MSAIDDAVQQYRSSKQQAARAELAQLRGDLQAAHERIAELEERDKYCPLCTWRGPVELVDGVCPQCSVNWPREYAAHRDALTVAKTRLTELEAAVNEAREYMNAYIAGAGITRTLRAWLAAHPAHEETAQFEDAAPLDWREE